MDKGEWECPGPTWGYEIKLCAMRSKNVGRGQTKTDRSNHT